MQPDWVWLLSGGRCWLRWSAVKGGRQCLLLSINWPRQPTSTRYFPGYDRSHRRFCF